MRVGVAQVDLPGSWHHKNMSLGMLPSIDDIADAVGACFATDLH